MHSNIKIFFLFFLSFCIVFCGFGAETISQIMNQAQDYKTAKSIYDEKIKLAKEELNKAIEAEKKYPKRDEPKELIRGWTENIFLWDKAYSLRIVYLSERDIDNKSPKYMFVEYNKGLTAISNLLSILREHKAIHLLYNLEYYELITMMEGAKNKLNEIYLSKLRLIYNNLIDEDIAIPLKEYAEQGNPEVQYILAICYQEGNGVKQNKKEAIKWLHKSAEQGNVQALYKLGHCYYVGEDVGKDKEKAVKYYRQAAEHGLAEAQYQLAVCLLYGEGVKTNRKESVSWFMKAAAQGHSKAKSALNIQTDVDHGENNTADKSISIKVGRNTSAIILDHKRMTFARVFENFVGFDDNVDFARIDLTSSAYLCFDLEATDTAEFTVWKKENGGKLKKITSTELTPKNDFTSTTKTQFFEANIKYEYYVSMECPDAAEGRFAYYNIRINKNSLLFDSADNGKNNALYEKKEKSFYTEDEKHHFVITAISAGTNIVKLDDNAVGKSGYSNFVGYDDAMDYAIIHLNEPGNLFFTITATGEATFTVYRKGLDKKGKESLDTIQSTKLGLTKDTKTIEKTTEVLVNLEPGDYFISMTATNTKANNDGCVFYNVKATLIPSTPIR